MPVRDSWTTVALPILEYLARSEGNILKLKSKLETKKVANSIGVDASLVVLELDRLCRGGYIAGNLVRSIDVDSVYVADARLTVLGARCAKLWPENSVTDGTSSGPARGFLSLALSTLISVATAVAAIIATLYLVAPNFKPKEKLGASIVSMEVQQQMSFLEYKLWTRRGGGTPQELAFKAEQDQWKGDLALVRVTLNGYEDKRYAAVVVPINVSDNKLIVQYAPTRNPLRALCDQDSPAANEDSKVFRCWSLSPPKDTKYYLRAEFFDSSKLRGNVYGPENVLMDFRRSTELKSAGSPF